MMAVMMNLVMYAYTSILQVILVHQHGSNLESMSAEKKLLTGLVLLYPYLLMVVY